jgi:hypothetical protein
MASAILIAWRGSCSPFCAAPTAAATKSTSTKIPVIVDVTIGATTIQITMTAADPGDPVKGPYVTVALPRDALTAAMASATARPNVNASTGVVPVFTTYFGPRTDEAGLDGAAGPDARRPVSANSGLNLALCPGIFVRCHLLRLTHQKLQSKAGLILALPP